MNSASKMIDFTYDIFQELLVSLKSNHYQFITIADYLNKPIQGSAKTCIMRHDVDRLPANSLNTAIIENKAGICGSYYFRIVPDSYNEIIIKNISELGHEIGYHYEDIDLTLQNKRSKIKNNNDIEAIIDMSYESFCSHLNKMRQVTEVKTICMHGSPMSKYDNRLIWTKYNYRDLDLIGEPYYDIDYNLFAYFTDTGRRWNGHDISVRDKVDSVHKYDIKSTNSLIARINELPDNIMFTFHPQRWNNRPTLWISEFVLQNFKNIIKKYYYVQKSKA
jgi:hypothetical protein